MRVWPAKDCGRDTHGDYRFLYSTAGTLFFDEKFRLRFLSQNLFRLPLSRAKNVLNKKAEINQRLCAPIKHRASPILGLLSFTPPPKATHLVGLDWIDH